jgi:glycine/D-amino acid oxidase-like deaminating enzyme
MLATVVGTLDVRTVVKSMSVNNRDDDETIDEFHLDAIADADPYPYWYDDADEPDSNPTLVRTESCDLLIVGGGYTGLWTAIIAKERDPNRDVVLIEAHEVGSAASGRNGGFMESSLTHGVANGQERFPHELPLLEELGLQNLNEIEAAIQRYNIDCDYERTGVIDVATTYHAANYADELKDDYQQLRSLGQSVELLDRDAMRAQVDSPTYTGGLWRKERAAIVDPARLAWGLKRAAQQLGVRIYEDTKAISLDKDGMGVLVQTPLGRVRAAKVALATNAFKPLLKRIGHYIAPVYDYCLVTEPLSPSQLSDIGGWVNRQGLSDIPNQFHYYRLTSDNRILWGGYDVIYYWRGKVHTDLESRPETWAKLSKHFFNTFPQLEGLKFTHVWGGAIDTCSRYSVFWGQAMQGRVAYAVGYTGLGVASTRFGAEVMVDLLDGRRSKATLTDFVKEKPIPFPPEPFRFIGIQATRASLDYEDRTGKRNLWLRTMDRMGLGFDS